MKNQINASLMNFGYCFSHSSVNLLFFFSLLASLSMKYILIHMYRINNVSLNGDCTIGDHVNIQAVCEFMHALNLCLMSNHLLSI